MSENLIPVGDDILRQILNDGQSRPIRADWGFCLAMDLIDTRGMVDKLTAERDALRSENDSLRNEVEMFRNTLVDNEAYYFGMIGELDKLRAELAQAREALKMLLDETLGIRLDGTWQDAIDKARVAIAGKDGGE